MKFVIGLLFFIFLALGTAKIEAKEIYDMRTLEHGAAEDFTIADFWMAYGVAVETYGYAPPPTRVVLSNSLIVQTNILGFYDPSSKSVWLNMSSIEASATSGGLQPREKMIVVLIHEIGHHLLAERGVSFLDQHCKMYGSLDAKAIGLLGFDPANYADPFRAFFACSHKES